MDAGRCLRNLPYNVPVPEPLRAPVGTILYGCDICQRICPRNAGQMDCAPPAALRQALRLEALLAGEYKALAPFLGANYARRGRVMGRAALIAGNLGDRRALPRLKELARISEPPMREHAAWAVRRIESAY